jgi:hypothetical protein
LAVEQIWSKRKPREMEKKVCNPDKQLPGGARNSSKTNSLLSMEKGKPRLNVELHIDCVRKYTVYIL